MKLSLLLTLCHGAVTGAQHLRSRKLYAIAVPDYDAADPMFNGLRIPSNGMYLLCNVGHVYLTQPTVKLLMSECGLHFNRGQWCRSIRR